MLVVKEFFLCCVQRQNRADWQRVTNWHIWQHNDEEGDRTTQAIIQESGEGYTVGTVNHLYEGQNDLNSFRAEAPDTSRAAMKCTDH